MQPFRLGSSDDEAEQPLDEICRAHSEGYKVVCELTRGHVKSMDDWHAAQATIDEHVVTNIIDVTVHRTEHIRWAPNIFELSHEERVKQFPSMQEGKTPTPRAD
jgi:hypothetical protein